ncbi:hypothetical protein ILUMI_13343, partial [Ignelater luminosus]
QSNLSCKKAEEICRAAEVSHYQVKELDNGNAKQVDVVYTTKTGTKPKRALKDGDLLYDCFKCGGKHDSIRLGKVVNENNFLNTVWTIDAIINNQNVKLKLDTGASCNCMPLKLFKSLGFDVNNIVNDDLSIITYGKNKIKTKGTVVIECVIKRARYNIKFLLIEQAQIPALGLNACTKLQLLKKVDSVGLSFTNKDEFVAKNKEVFDGTGLNLSPAELLCKRMLRTTLPVSSNILNKEPHINLEQLNTKRLKAKKYYDQHSQHCDVFKVGDSVLLQKEKGKQWDEFGRVLRRNTSFLKKRLSNTTAHWRAIDFDFDDTVEPSPSVSSVPEVSINGNSSVPQITKTGRVINKPVRYRN